jgi:hypothetical protein
MGRGNAEHFSLGNLATVAAGTAIDVGHLYPGSVTLFVAISSSPAWDGTIVLEGSSDGVTFATLPTTQNGYNVATEVDLAYAYVVPGSVKQVRARCSEHDAGTAYIRGSGWNPNR